MCYGGGAMGTFKVEISVSDGNGGQPERFDALVDSGASLTVIPGTVLQRMGVEPTTEAVFTYGDGRREALAIGQTRIDIDGRSAFSPVVFGRNDGCLLGATTLQTLLLIPDTTNHRLIPAPILTI